MTYEDRHPATQEIMQWFAFDHLPEGRVRETSSWCASLAATMTGNLPDGPELTAGLRHLLEAKDAFVRQAVKASRAE